MKDFLFLFTIGPVQNFIALARKTQDLYAGSYLLSHFCRVAGKKAEKLTGNKAILPNLDNLSIPNRFIIKVNNVGNLQELGVEIENTVRSEIKIIADTILNKMNIKEPPYHFYEQLEHYFSIFWIFYPVGDKGYAHAYQEIERLMGAIKNVRSFSQLAEVGRKCSLDGQYNALFYKPRVNGKPPAFVEKDINGIGNPIEIKDNLLIQAGEGLSAVSFLKRFLKEADSLFQPKFSFESNFPSTARIALLHIISKLKNSRDLNGQISLKKYEDSFGRDFDEQLYYEENLTKNYFQKQGLSKFIDAIPILKKNLKEISKLALSKGYKFTKYYALILYDADNMGKWNAGKFLKDNKKNQLENFHKSLTIKLSKFGNYTKDYINLNSFGKTVYAAGDEFLGFVNLFYLFEVLQHLRHEFEQQIDLSEFSDQKMTFSAGVVIAHYKMPLSEVLKWVRRMEKTAKDMHNKNAFAIAVMKHSGEINQTVLPWKIEPLEATQKNLWLPKIIEQIAKHISKNQFSNTFIKNLSYEFLCLKDENDYIHQPKKEAIKSEIKRLVKRSFVDKTASVDNREKIIGGMSEDVYQLFEICMTYFNQQPVSNFLSALHIADFISREVSYVD